MRRETVNLLIGLCSGMVVGVASALLLAPMSGSKARGRVKEAATRMGRSVQGQAKAKAEQVTKSTRAARRAVREKLPKLQQKLDLNAATRDELTQLVGIGPASADEIVKYREAHGGFRSVDELDEVYGFGEIMAKKVKDQVFVSETPEAMSI